MAVWRVYKKKFRFQSPERRLKRMVNSILEKHFQSAAGDLRALNE